MIVGRHTHLWEVSSPGTYSGNEDRFEYSGQPSSSSSASSFRPVIWKSLIRCHVMMLCPSKIGPRISSGHSSLTTSSGAPPLVGSCTRQNFLFVSMVARTSRRQFVDWK